jgi:hypothetical protein
MPGMTHPWRLLGALTGSALVVSCLASVPAAASPRTSSHASARPGSGPARIVQELPGPRVAGAEGPGAQSTNWSGYVATHAGVQLVHARWVVPAATCTPNDTNFQDTSFWVGIDGWADGTVEQAGTDVSCGPHSTTPTYVAWWEMYPTNAEQPEFAVSPGDHIDASVTFANGSYVLTVKDLTTGKSFSRTKKCGAGLTCKRTSAEWIAESPSYGTALADLAGYKTWKPTGMTMTVSGGPAATGPATYTYIPVTMVTTGGTTRAKVSADLLTTARNTFLDTLVHAGVS